MLAARTFTRKAFAPLILAIAINACAAVPTAESTATQPPQPPVTTAASSAAGEPVVVEEILSHLSVPRPAHSPAVEETANYLTSLLTEWGIPFVIQEFPLRYHMLLLVGAAVFALAVLLFILILKKKSIAALVVALIIPLLLIAEFELFTPIVSGLLQKTGQNIVITYDVPNPERELIFAAHYDSKTDVYDHLQRARINSLIPVAACLGIVVAGFTFFSRKYALLKRRAVTAVVLFLAGSIVVYWGLVLIEFGGYVLIPPDRQSLGSVDDGASVVSLLMLSQDIHNGKVNLGESNVTILLTAGEEVTMQGAHSYVQEYLLKRQEPGLPASLVNLELIGQNGGMIYFEKDGVLIRYYDANADLIDRVGQALDAVAGGRLEPSPKIKTKITDDALCFMAAGIPAITIANSGVPGSGLAGFHSVDDNPDRIHIDNIGLTVRTLARYIEDY